MGRKKLRYVVASAALDAFAVDYNCYESREQLENCLPCLEGYEDRDISIFVLTDKKERVIVGRKHRGDARITWDVERLKR